MRVAIVDTTQNLVTNVVLGMPDWMPANTIGISLPDNSPVSLGYTYNPATQTFAYGQTVDQVAAQNGQTLLNKAAAAIASNITFLGLASPTNAQAVAQVQALTRQVDAIIKLLVDQLADTTGT